MGLKLFHSSHHCGSPRQTSSQDVIGLVECGELSANAAGEQYGVSKSTARAWLQEYRKDGQAVRRPGTGLWHVASPNQNPALATRFQGIPFTNARKLKIATDMIGQKCEVTWRHRRNLA